MRISRSLAYYVGANTLSIRSSKLPDPKGSEKLLKIFCSECGALGASLSYYNSHKCDKCQRQVQSVLNREK